MRRDSTLIMETCYEKKKINERFQDKSYCHIGFQFLSPLSELSVYLEIQNRDKGKIKCVLFLYYIGEMD